MQAICHPWRIAVRDLACRRGDRLLFRGLDATVEAGSALHVAGANGIGKSSLIRIMAGLLHPFAGVVEREGAIALLDERPALDPHLPLGKALGFWSALDDAGTGLAARLDRLGMGDLSDVPVRFLSTGQRKRAALARLLGQGAPVWLLDEPLNGLDRDAVRMVEYLVERHCAEGGIAVIASHQPMTVARMQTLPLQDFAA